MLWFNALYEKIDYLQASKGHNYLTKYDRVALTISTGQFVLHQGLVIF